ncbi:MAG: bifunctional hydroxymethylpyrimidine kinase/phosphomethylpyrimidine kinase [Clostridia bacterium]|jgi:ribokinase|nr:bifunctional hydroxymethylpyrimidine kinase/phosphomethylpyrimidine kinase [Clostridia bacterium]
MRKRILTVGRADMNMILNTSAIPAANGVVEGLNYSYAPGGGGSVAAVSFAKLSADSVFCARVGDDENGIRLIKYYNDCGVDTRYITRDSEVDTGFSALINEAGISTRTINYPGANKKFGREDLENGFMSYPDALFLQFELPDRECVAATRLAKRQEIPVFIDAGPRKFELPLELLENVEIFSPNEEEAYHYTGVYPSDPEKCLKVCMALCTKINAKYIVLKLGRRGSFIYDGKYYHVVPAYDITFVDGSAAGDVFSAALTTEYLRHGDIKAACEFANLAGAIAVSREGSYNAVPTRKDVEKYAEHIGIKLS